MDTTTSTINLEKGQKIDLTKTNPNVAQFHVGLGWDANGAVGSDFDLDVSAFILGANGKKISDKHMIFYNNLKSENGMVEHTGDNLTGQGDGDDEALIIDFSKATGDEDKIVFVVSIHKAQERNQNFGQVKNAFIRVADKATPEVNIAKFDLSEDASIETSMQFGALYKKDGEWKFEAIGTGVKEGLQHYIDLF